MLAFMDCIEKDGNYIGGYLGTDDELIPIEFSLTDAVKPPTALEKILHGERFELKWFGDLIAGTLYEGTKKGEESPDKEIEAIFISDKRMLHLRRKTGNTPVVCVGENNEVVAYENHDQDIQAINSILERIENPNLVEVFNRIKAGIEECLSSEIKE